MVFGIRSFVSPKRIAPLDQVNTEAKPKSSIGSSLLKYLPRMTRQKKVEPLRHFNLYDRDDDYIRPLYNSHATAIHSQISSRSQSQTPSPARPEARMITYIDSFTDLTVNGFDGAVSELMNAPEINVSLRIDGHEYSVCNVKNHPDGSLGGRGKFTRVLVGADENQNRVAIKVSTYPVGQEPLLRRFRKEGLSQLNFKGAHPNVMGAELVAESAESVFIVMSEQADGDLSDFYVKNRNLNNTYYFRQAITYVTGAAKGLEYLHSENYIHGDIKPANIFCHQGSASIGDFGTLRRLLNGCEEISSLSGTYGYLAPETIEQSIKSKASDVFSFGATLYTIFNRKSLPAFDNGVPNLSQIDWESFSQKAGDSIASCIKKCLSLSPENRPSMREVREALEKL